MPYPQIVTQDSRFTRTYWFFDNDTATASTPINHTGGASNTYLTNNSLGSATDAHNPDLKDNIWDPSTNKFDFTSLKIGDTIEFRISIEIDNAAAQEADLVFSLAEGSDDAYDLNIGHVYYKTAATGTPVTVLFRIYMGDESTRANPARIRFESPTTTAIKVLGWFVQITEV